MTADELIGDFLGELERDEARLLGWGLVEGFFTEKELIHLSEEFLEKNEDGWSVFTSASGFLSTLEELGLIFSWVEGGSEKRYRTRMAESVRLVAGLKQIFPKHLKHAGNWHASPSLVSDFRFINRPRQSPRRDQNPTTSIPKWVGNPAELTPLQRKVIEAMLSDGKGGYFPLSGFQERATTRILQEVREENISATMVCAGTGSGKTLAFYLPALTHLAGLIAKDSSRWVRALAIYPRNELLKDQISETLLQLSRINPVLREAGIRPLCVGTLFGPTPKDGSEAVIKNWRSQPGKGRICPFLACPTPGCDSPLIWTEDDIQEKIERVSCPKCGHKVQSDEIVLTRKGLNNGPPDLLFTTTEMINQRLSDSKMWKLFGVGMPPSKKPAFLLLDEAHTYTGLHGAQVAYLLRRWQRRSGAKPHVVGLSATLMEARTFLARLAGIPEAKVEEISPEPGEMKSIGMEYLLAIRGDPVSGASLLSTTIQTAMLIRRVLDPTKSRTSNGFFGKKVFLFTDDLDATNRLYFNLLDAEGQDSWGKLDTARHPVGSLANLRSPNQLQVPGFDGLCGDDSKRFQFGQSWRLASKIGHEFHQSVRIPIGRVSSQDSGVSEESEVIVATASLEVGFNDPCVGAVIQHKAPRDPASFLQRKGRAGRRMEMRPWTVVVLSDFGRDRLAYQGYDLLFDPELKPRELPLENRHVLKMQAVFAMMDWLGIQLGETAENGSVWESIDIPNNAAYNDLSPNSQNKWRSSRAQRQSEISRKLKKILEGEDEFSELKHWIKGALSISDKTVQALFWDPPRALMTSVIPTLYRRLNSQWEECREFYQFWKPLPEFIPANLFSGLNVPEVNIETYVSRDKSKSDPPKTTPLRIDQALREFAPGRISKRFGVEHGFLRHWIPLEPNQEIKQHIDISSFIPDLKYERIGEFAYLDETQTLKRVQTIRPYTIRTTNDAPKTILDSSNALPIWHSQLLEPYNGATGLAIDLPAKSEWSNVIKEIRFFVHSQFCPARIRRFTLGSNASLNLDNGNVCEIESRYISHKANPVALGFAFEADAIRIRVQPPKDWKLEDGESKFSGKVPSLRAARYRWLVKNDDELKRVCNAFVREQIAEVSLSAIIATAAMNGVTVQEAWRSIRSGESEINFANALEVLFQTIADEDSEDESNEPKRLKELRDLLGSPETIQQLNSIVPVLWRPIQVAEWQGWLTDRFLATLGAAFRDAIQQMCPSIDADSLVVDINPGPRDDGTHQQDDDLRDIWLSESEPGGGGVIERFLPEIAESPRRFFELVKSALAPGDFEQSDRELRRLLEHLCGPQKCEELAASVFNVRNANTIEERVQNFESLRSLMNRMGFVASHVVVAAMSSRLLKIGSNTETDKLCWEITKRWDKAELDIGIELDARSFAYTQSALDELDHALNTQSLALDSRRDIRNWRFNSVYGMLWPKGSHARNQSLSLRNPYAVMPETERFLVQDALAKSEPPVKFLSTDWQAKFRETLIINGRGKLQCQPDELVNLKKEILSLLIQPLDTGSLLVFPRLRGIGRDLETWTVEFELTVQGSPPAPESDDDYDNTKSRLIVRSAEGNREEVRDLLESILAIEILSPGKKLWLVSPWVTDIPLLDNRTGCYSGLDPAWPKRRITLAELLATLVARSPSMRICVVTRPPENFATNRFIDRLNTLTDFNLNSNKISLDCKRATLHTKGLVGDQFALSGSMNFTNNGIEVNEESVQFQIDDYTIADFLKNFAMQYNL